MNPERLNLQDAASIRTGLAAGLAGISANVTADIQRAAMAIQTAFGAQVASPWRSSGSIVHTQQMAEVEAPRTLDREPWTLHP